MSGKNYENDIRKWWDSASSYYQEEISGDRMTDVNYGPFGSSEEKLKLLGGIRGKNILEIGCGGGQASIALAKKGGICTAIDISAEQINTAVKNAVKSGVTVNFMRMPFSSINKLKEREFDIIISVMSLQYCSDLNRLFKRIKKLLKPEGVFVFSIEHPFYLLINPDNMKIEESYFNEGVKRKKEVWPDKSVHYFVYYDHKISTIVNSILSSGLKLERIVEPLQLKDKVWGAGYRKALVNRIGPTIIFKCRN
jgi:cyclopropane fatty-acyl-phospholipid synthase-like methyltransferase